MRTVSMKYDKNAVVVPSIYGMACMLNGSYRSIYDKFFLIFLFNLIIIGFMNDYNDSVAISPFEFYMLIH